MADKIIYTLTDEAPALATYSFLPIVQRYLNEVSIDVEVKNISLASRILAAFSEELPENHKVNDALEELGQLVHLPSTNIIKLPNISASVPQLRASIKELQEKGFDLPNYPLNPATKEEFDIREKYDKVKGSAVNPVLREGNSDRRAPKAVKEFAKKNPHSMGPWSGSSKSHVSSMQQGDFYANEKSLTMAEGCNVKIIFSSESGEETILKESTLLLQGEVIDATFLNINDYKSFLKHELNDAKDNGVLFSLHLKATMMKVSDPVLFGHAVEVFFQKVFQKYASKLQEFGANPNNGWRNVLNAIEQMDEQLRAQIIGEVEECLVENPDLAMVNSDKGIGNLHVPSDVIIDASMPAMIRNGGKMWNAEGMPQDAKAIVPDRTYAGIYQEVIEFCKKNGAFDPSTMGTVPNVGLMAQKAEEYGSHDKTFVMKERGIVRVVNEMNETLLQHEVNEGDIWRMCQTKKRPIINWIELAVERARASQWPAVFWLDEKRAHDKELIGIVEEVLSAIGLNDFEVHILPPAEAMRYTLERVKNGMNTISVTGNVLRDYLTDLFPILELGTSAKMLSIVPLMKGGGLFETGAGGSAPKHVQQFVKENHLRWDSLGEFLALSVSLDHLSKRTNNMQAAVLARALDEATERLLVEGKSPSRRVNEIDNRGSHFYLALFWAEALAKQSNDMSIKKKFIPLAKSLRENEEKITNELLEVQGEAVDLKGYYCPDCNAVENAMRPSKIFNKIISIN
ncbi:MAG: isocitrate dehydrogenase (NADP(+)) [Verrucomicrobia bacterium]|nr:isocitrate dehydrogenase (NADP(+)) [Verrucomicrobiota bacterium]